MDPFPNVYKCCYISNLTRENLKIKVESFNPHEGGEERGDNSPGEGVMEYSNFSFIINSNVYNIDPP